MWRYFHREFIMIVSLLLELSWNEERKTGLGNKSAYKVEKSHFSMLWGQKWEYPCEGRMKF